MTAADLHEIPGFLERKKPLIWTYTLLNTYRICPEQMQRRYIRKDIPYQETPEMKWGNDVHAALENRIERGTPLPEKMLQWERFALPFVGRRARCEIKLGITRAGTKARYWDDPTCFGRGKVDVAIVNDASAYIADWKTSKKPREDPFELEIGALLLKANHPGLKKVVGQYFWLRDNQPGQMYDLSNSSKTWAEVNHLVKSMEQDSRDNQWEKRDGPLCGWCNVGDCEHNRNQK